jgi:hypothetical protein
MPNTCCINVFRVVIVRLSNGRYGITLIRSEMSEHLDSSLASQNQGYDIS